MKSPDTVFEITRADVKSALSEFEDALLIPGEFEELCEFVKGHYEDLAPQELDDCVADYIMGLEQLDRGTGFYHA